MQILKVNYVNGNALFVVDKFQGKTFVVSLDGMKTRKQVTEKLQSLFPEISFEKKTFDDLKIKELEGTDI